MYGVDFQTQEEQQPKEDEQSQEQQEVAMKTLKGHRKDVPAQIFRQHIVEVLNELCSN